MNAKFHLDKLFKIIRIAHKLKKKLELWKFGQVPRYTVFQTKILNYPLTVIDSASFRFMYDEIFIKGIYRFKSDNDNPLIIDCGANIGLSIIYFKELFPSCTILAFEPDKQVFEILRENVLNFGLSDVEVLDKAVWSGETTLEFMSEGADGGRVVAINDHSFSKYPVNSVRLRDYLLKPVDFLKLDIEGAETEVLQDCKDVLYNVKHLFVEYHSFVDRPQTLHILIPILSDAGFRIHIHPPVISPHPFVSRNVSMGMDMQLNIFAFREAH